MPAGKLRESGVYMRQHLSHLFIRKAAGVHARVRIRQLAGNPTVRDRREARGNVAMRTGLVPAAERLRDSSAGSLTCARPGSIPTEQPTML